MHSKAVAGLTSLSALVLLLTASPMAAQISLGTAGNFGVLGGSTVTNTGSTVVNGSVGVSPGTAVTGFPPGVVIGGTIHSNDGVAIQAQVDLVTAYDEIEATPCTVDLTGQDLGGLTLTPGVYCFDTSAQLTGALTLDALGNPDALFLFKTGSTLTTASGSSVTVINGGSACNSVFWQVGSSATIGTATSFAGDILALTSITLTTGADTSGRLLARNGAVTLDTNTINTCGPLVCAPITLSPATLDDGEVGVVYSDTVTASGGTPDYTYTISSGSLPPGLGINSGTGEISGTPLQAGTFSFTVTAVDAGGCRGSRPYTINVASSGCAVITISPSTLPPGTVAFPYAQQVTASGGTEPYLYEISTGELPPGLDLDSATGFISGIPQAAGIYTFTIQATDAGDCVGARQYTLTILAALPAVPLLDPFALAMLALLIAAVGAFAIHRVL